MSVSKFLESKRGKALIGLVCSFAVICVTVTGLFAGGLFKAKDSVPKRPLKKQKPPSMYILCLGLFNSKVQFCKLATILENKGD